MKEEINLLPLPQRQLRTRRLHLYRLGQLLRRADLALAVLAGALLAAYIGMESVSSSLANRAPLPVDADTAIIAQVEEVNTLLKTVHEHNQSVSPWTPLVAEALTSMPEGMRLTSVKVDSAARQVTLLGEFTARDSVVEFQRRLSQLTDVENVEAPLRNFATGGDNNFSFTLTRAADL